MAQNDPHDNSIPATHWYAETPLLIEALADTMHTSILDVCEHLEDGIVGGQMPAEDAVNTFINDYILDEAA